MTPSDHRPRKGRDRYDLAICTMIQGENSYLPEWIAHHLGLGVEHFFIYDNESPTPLELTLEPEIKEGRATVIPIRGRFRQLDAFNLGLLRFGRKTEWMAFMDLDEFLLPKRHDCLQDLLAEYREFGGLAVNWQMFGSSGHEVRPPGLQMENFLMRAEVDYVHNRHVKSIVRPEAVDQVVSTHYCRFRPGIGSVNERRVPVEGEKSAVSVDIVQINHYYTRSRKEYSEKLERGRVDHEGPLPFTFEEIDRDLNAVRDETLLGFAPRVKEYLAERARR